MNGKVLLCNPWITDFAAYDFWLKPLGLLYIAAVLRQYSYDISLIDCMDRYDPELLNFQGLQSPNNIYYSTGKFHRQVIQKPGLYKNIPRNYARYGFPLQVFRSKLGQTPEPDVVLITSGMTYWYQGVQLAIEEIRKIYSDVPIVLGGIYPTLCHKHAKETTGADFVITGEGELAALKIVDSLTGNKRDYNAFSEQIDELPYPAFDLYKNLTYITILTSRGCPLKCTFCASSLVSGQYRRREPSKVVDEVQYYYERLKIKEFAFYDDALLTDHKNHFSIILKEIINKGWDVSFHTPNGIQTKHLDKNIAEKMFQAGFKTIHLSYETGNPDRQNDMCKKVTNDTFIRGVRYLCQAGYKTGSLKAYILAALPGQSIEEVLWSMAFVHSQGVKIRLAVFSPIPGTVEWQRAKQYSDYPENADPLLANNSIIPIQPPGTTLSTFDKINSLANHLNLELATGQIHRDVESQVRQMKSQF